MNAIVSEARSYVGVRWRHQGRNRDGVDCIGLPIVCARATFGFNFDITNYSRTSGDESMLQACQQHLHPVATADAAPGDVAVMGFGRQRHMVIFGDYPEALGGGLSIIHAHLLNRKVVECRLDSIWRSRIIACFRFPERSCQF